MLVEKYMIRSCHDSVPCPKDFLLTPLVFDRPVDAEDFMDRVMPEKNYYVVPILVKKD